LVGYGVMQVGVTLASGQLSAKHHGDSLMQAARLLAHGAAHTAQRALRLADSHPTDLRCFVEKLQLLAQADGEVERAVRLPKRLNTLYQLLESYGVDVPPADQQYVDRLRSWGQAIQAKHAALHKDVREPMPQYAKEAIAAAYALRATIATVLCDAMNRGVFNGESVAERMRLLAQRATTQLATVDAQRAPVVRDWLQTLGQDSSLLRLSALAVAEMRVACSGWELLSAWRRLFKSYLEMPLVKLQIRSTGMEAELRRYEDAAHALLECSAPNVCQARDDAATHGRPEEAATSMVSVVATAAAISAPVSSRTVGGARKGPSHPACELLLGGLVCDGVNVVVAHALREIGEWRIALPLVLKLVHPHMHAVQWHRIFAFAPVHTLEAALAQDNIPAGVPAEAHRKAYAGMHAYSHTDAAPLAAVPAVSLTASAPEPEQTRTRPLCLDTIWAERDKYASIIETVQEETIANHVAQAAATEAKACERARGRRSKKRNTIMATMS